MSVYVYSYVLAKLSLSYPVKNMGSVCKVKTSKEITL